MKARAGKPFQYLSTCPWCLRTYDGMACLHRADDPAEISRPNVGDVTMCPICHNPAILGAAGVWRKPLPLEMGQLLADPHFRRTQEAMAVVEREQGPYEDMRPNRRQRRAARRR